MRAVVQRAANSAVNVSGKETGAITKGLVVLLGVGEEDDEKDVEYMADKIANLRIFEDDNGKINLSCLDIGGEMLGISQFTLYGDCRKGRRPSFQLAAEPGKAERYYEYFVDRVRKLGVNVSTGDFGENMMVKINNDGPVTLILDSKKNL